MSRRAPRSARGGRPPGAGAARRLARAMQLHRAGQLAEAEALYRALLRERPDEPDALQLLGMVAHQGGRHAEAAELVGRAITLRPAVASYHNNYGSILRRLGRPAEAAASFERALALQPDLDLARVNRARALRDADQPDQAEPELRRALARRPADPDARYELGRVLMELGRPAEAQAEFERAVALRPEHAEAHLGLAFASLVRGDFARGWAEHEWRWRVAGLTTDRPEFDRPAWQGEPLDGRTILLHAEQGLGDAIQFARYAACVRARGGRVILGCQPSLGRLFRTLDGPEQVVTTGGRLPPFDLHAPLMSLPPLLGQPEPLPAATPYLSAAPSDIATWSERLAGPPGPKVGLVWAGNPEHRDDRRRSMPLAALAPLGQVPGLRLFSLQKGSAAAGQLATPPPGLTLTDLAPNLDDFADTAAALEALDLVIAVDTAVAHLAGALGRPIWLLLASAADWRWLLDRDDSPWYSSLRIFRQRRRGDWDEVVRRVASALGEIGPEDGLRAIP